MEMSQNIAVRVNIRKNLIQSPPYYYVHTPNIDSSRGHPKVQDYSMTGLSIYNIRPNKLSQL